MGREFELKYAAEETALEALAAEYPALSPIAMETTYYDVPGGQLSRLRWTLRRRMENGVSVCTLKTPLPDGSRGEWEVECGSIEGGIPLLIEAGAPKELLYFTANGVREICAARFTRLACPVVLSECTVELALDRGVLSGGGRELPFAEVEVELKSGDEAAAVQFANILAARYGLREEKKSKFKRALDLTICK